MLFGGTFVAKIDSRVREAIHPRGLRFQSVEARVFDVRDVWWTERIAAAVAGDGSLKSRRIDDLMDDACAIAGTFRQSP